MGFVSLTLFELALEPEAEAVEGPRRLRREEARDDRRPDDSLGAGSSEMKLVTSSV